MGLCSSAEGNTGEMYEAKTTPNAIDDEQEYDKAKNALRFKVLCLGAGESGKSTVVKQLKLLQNGKMPDSDLKPYVSVLHENTLQCMAALLKAAAKLEMKIEGDAEIAAAERITKAAAAENMPEEFIMSPELAEDVVTLWNSPCIKAVFARKNEFWILDGAEYYFDRCKAACAPGFIPTEEDVIMARARTTGIVTTEIYADDITWMVVDVGGQRSERKKWINCFEDVKGVLFVVNLAGYASVLFEDEKKNRMSEAMELFGSISAEPIFVNTPLFLFFNKKDLFEQQLQRTSLKSLFPDYEGKEGKESDAGDAIAFITKKFIERVSPKRTGPPVTTWPVAARHKKDVQYSFQELREQLVSQNKAAIKKAVATVKQVEEKRKKKEEDDTKSSSSSSSSKKK